MKTLKLQLFPLLFLLAFSFFQTEGAERVRVETRHGVPLVVVDGQPVRSRIFWGGPTRSVPITLTKEWKEYSAVFTSQGNSEGRGTVHFRFSDDPGVLYLDDITVTEVESGRVVMPLQQFEKKTDYQQGWTCWPVGKDNKVGVAEVVAGKGYKNSGALSVTLSNLLKGRARPDYHIYCKPTLKMDQGKKYRFSFKAMSPDGIKISHAFYRPGSPFMFLGNNDETDKFVSQIKLAADAGVNFVSFPLPFNWPQKGVPQNWDMTDRACERVLAANPDALLLPRIGLDAPNWWLLEHPDETMVWKNHPKPTRPVASVSSEIYRRDAANAVALLVQHLEEKYGPHMAGYHPCGQNTGEWFYQDTWYPAYNGYAPCDELAWRKWLTKEYKNDSTLQTKWGIKNVTLSSVTVPTMEQRMKTRDEQLYLNPGIGSPDRMQFDFNRFQQDMMIDTVLDFAKAVRKASEGKRMVVFFYGYIFEFGSVINGPTISGHYALKKALRSPDVDIWCSPISYYDRAPGQSGPAMTAAESVALAGKIWLYEDDTRTYLAPERTFAGAGDGADTPEGTIELLLRNTAQCAVRNFGSWWMDLGSSGWFNDKRFWDEMKKLKGLDQWFLDHPTPFEPQIAAFVDEDGMPAVPNRRVTTSSVRMVRSDLARVGTPYGQYLLDDYLAGRTHAKVNVFLNPCILTKEKRALLAAKSATGFSVWGFGSGWLDADKGPSPESVKELTGFAVKKVELPNGDVTPTKEGKAFGLTTAWGKEPSLGRNDFRFAVTDAKPGEILAVHSDGSAAVVLRRTPAGGWSLFVGIPAFQVDLFRGAAKKAGITLLTEQNCNVYANGPFIILHGAKDSPVTLTIDKDQTLVDLFTNRKIGQGPTVTVPVKKAETKLFKTVR